MIKILFWVALAYIAYKAFVPPKSVPPPKKKKEEEEKNKGFSDKLDAEDIDYEEIDDE